MNLFAFYLLCGLTVTVGTFSALRVGAAHLGAPETTFESGIVEVGIYTGIVGTFVTFTITFSLSKAGTATHGSGKLGLGVSQGKGEE